MVIANLVHIISLEIADASLLTRSPLSPFSPLNFSAAPTPVVIRVHGVLQGPRGSASSGGSIHIVGYDPYGEFHSLSIIYKHTFAHLFGEMEQTVLGRYFVVACKRIIEQIIPTAILLLVKHAALREWCCTLEGFSEIRSDA